MHAACSSTRYESVKDRLNSQYSQEQTAVTPAPCELPGIMLVEATVQNFTIEYWKSVKLQCNCNGGESWSPDFKCLKQEHACVSANICVTILCHGRGSEWKRPNPAKKTLFFSRFQVLLFISVSLCVCVCVRFDNVFSFSLFFHIYCRDNKIDVWENKPPYLFCLAVLTEDKPPMLNPSNRPAGSSTSLL